MKTASVYLIPRNISPTISVKHYLASNVQRPSHGKASRPSAPCLTRPVGSKSAGSTPGCDKAERVHHVKTHTAEKYVLTHPVLQGFTLSVRIVILARLVFRKLLRHAFRKINNHPCDTFSRPAWGCRLGHSTR